MKIINPNEDWHCHCSEFSDGKDTIESMVAAALEIGLKRIIFTDHSDAAYTLTTRKPSKKLPRIAPVYKGIDIVLGAEADILNEHGDVCINVFRVPAKVIVLSAHENVYFGKPELINQAYEHAIKKHKDKIIAIAHPCSYFKEHIDIVQLSELANAYQIPMEFDCKHLITKWTNIALLEKMLQTADLIAFNSDAHSARNLIRCRKEGMAYLKENGYVK